MIRKTMISLARSPWMGWLVGVVITRMSFLLPVQRLRETDKVLAFHHPHHFHLIAETDSLADR